MSEFAKNTTVSPDRSRNEIERTLQRWGADQFMYGWEAGQAVIQFRANDRLIRFIIGLPDRDDPAFTLTPARKTKRSPDDVEKMWEQAVRQRWRALALVIKAKLEAVEAGIAEFESEFLAHVVLPSGETAGEWMRPQIEVAYQTGVMPSMLPALGPGGGA